MSKLPLSFYQQPDVLQISKDLLGMYLVTQHNGVYTAGKIVETEAYNGRTDKACHAHLNRRTKRTEIMYAAGGVAYVYLCYGIHHLFNVVTNAEGLADAVLVRAVEPVEGIEAMLVRRSLTKPGPRISAGPGLTSQALGIDRSLYGTSLAGNTLWIEDRGQGVSTQNIVAGPRVGVAYAKEDALLPWRFSVAGNPWVSKAKGGL